MTYSEREKALYRIYILRCPLTQEPKYVGRTSQPLRQRLLGHLADKYNKKKFAWIQSLEKQNEFPIIELQCKVKGYRNAKTQERSMVVKLSKKYQLFNMVYNPVARIERVPAKYIIDKLPKIITLAS